MGQIYLWQFGKPLFKNVDSPLFCSLVLYKYQGLEFTSMLDCYVNFTEWRLAPTPLLGLTFFQYSFTHTLTIFEFTMILIWHWFRYHAPFNLMTIKLCTIYIEGQKSRARIIGLNLNLKHPYSWSNLPTVTVAFWLLCIKWAPYEVHVL